MKSISILKRATLIVTLLLVSVFAVNAAFVGPRRALLDAANAAVNLIINITPITGGSSGDCLVVNGSVLGQSACGSNRTANPQSVNYATLAADCQTYIPVTTGQADLTMTLLSATTAGNCTQIFAKADDGSIAVMGTGNNGSALVRVTVGSTTGMATGQIKTLNLVTGTAEANGTWTITVINGTQFDLQGSIFSNNWISGGIISGGKVIVSDGTARAWLSTINDNVALTSNGVAWTAPLTGRNIARTRQYFSQVGAITWVKAPLATGVRIYGVGAGDSGGSGRSGVTGTIRTGGAGGTPGCASWIDLPASALGATETITNVAGGIAATSVTGAPSTNGNSAVIPANATFGSEFIALAGNASLTGGLGLAAYGGGSTTTSVVGSSQAFRCNWGLPNAGISSISTGNQTQPADSGGPGGGGAGGAADASNTQRLPGLGALGSAGTAAPSAGGLAATSGNPGGAGGDVTNFNLQIGGGGGGGGFFVAATAGTAGGRGGNPGGGGGGGAAADTTFASGASGPGGNSAFMVDQFFN